MIAFFLQFRFMVSFMKFYVENFETVFACFAPLREIISPAKHAKFYLDSIFFDIQKITARTFEIDFVQTCQNIYKTEEF